MDSSSDRACWDEEDVNVLSREDRRSRKTCKMEDMEDDIAVVGIGCNFPGGKNNIYVF